MSFMVKELFGQAIEKNTIWQNVEVGLPLKTKKPKDKKVPYGRDIFDLARVISSRAYARRRRSMSSSII
jgi:hypothetical protein